MKTSSILNTLTRQRGIVSVIAVLVLAMVVLVILARSVSIKGSEALESQQYSDSMAALAVAESATELAKSKIISLYETSGLSSCTSGNLVTPSPNTMGNGTFSFGPAAVDTSNTYCKFRVKGTVGKASRTIETWIGFTDEIGTAGNGRFPSLTLKNKFAPAPSLAVFNLAWITFLTGSSPVLCSDCNSNQLWYDELTGSNKMGGVGNYTSTSVNPDSLTYQHTLGTQAGDDRHYSMVGLLIGGTPANPPNPAITPTTVGWMKFSNTSSAPNTSSQSASDSGLGTGCTDDSANAVVLGISGTGTNVNAGFDFADLNGVITTAMWRKYVHYPNTDSTSPGLITDVFSEIFYYTQEPRSYPGATGTKNSSTITFVDPVDLKVGETIKVSTNNGLPGVGEIPYKTTIKDVDITKKIVTLSDKIKTNNLNNATLCTGICSLVPQVKNASTLTLSRNSNTNAKGWVAGIACIKGAKTATLVTKSSPRVLKWHEVLSTDTSF